MSKRIHPFVLRTKRPYAKAPLSVSYMNNSHLPKYILEDIQIRQVASKVFPITALTEVVIERIHGPEVLLIFLVTYNSNALVGEDSVNIDKYKKIIKKKFGSKYKNIQVGVRAGEDKITDVQALVNDIKHEIESSNGTSYMKYIRSILESVKSPEKPYSSLHGVHIKISGRIAGGTIASNQQVKGGIIKANSIDHDVKLGIGHAKTKTGMMGIQVKLSREFVNRTKNRIYHENSNTERTRTFNKNRGDYKGKDFKKDFNKDGNRFNKNNTYKKFDNKDSSKINKEKV